MRLNSAQSVCEQLNVSCETSERLHHYVAVLSKWQAKINLISPLSLDDVWARHILDCGQLNRYIPNPNAQIMDIGSGGGLPGLVLAIMRQGQYGTETKPIMLPIILVESDERKCAFLSVAAQECGVVVKIINDRLESLPPLAPDVITARALAPMEKLLALTQAQHHEGLKCLFLKGQNADEELTCLKDYPKINCVKSPSLSSPQGVIVELTGFTAPKDN